MINIIKKTKLQVIQGGREQFEGEVFRVILDPLSSREEAYAAIDRLRPAGKLKLVPPSNKLCPKK
jgi:hypothetical protein